MFRLIKVIMLFVLVTAINGQALAIASMSCQHADNSHQENMKATANMDHYMHQMSAMGDEMHEKMDCCETQCICPTSGCSQSVYLSISNFDAGFNRITGDILTTESHFQSLAIPSAFKPPIFA